MSVATQLAQEVVQTKYEDIPQKAVDRIREAILDTIGCAFFVHLLDPRAPSIIKYAKEVGGGLPESTIIGDGTKVSCVFAAGVNATMSTSGDFDETGPGVHAFSNLAQTGVAVAERVGASGKELITAVALAYEINGRFARSAYPLGIIHSTVPRRDTSFPGQTRHYAATAAATAAKLLQLDEKQVQNSIGIGWRYTPAADLLKRNLMNSVGAFNLGACVWGVQAALLAQMGFEHPDNFIEREGRYDLEDMVSSPSSYYYCANELHLKPWILPRGAHPGLSAVLHIVREEGIKPEEIEEIRLICKNEFDDPRFAIAQPKEYREITGTIPWAFAMAILGVQPGPEWLAKEHLSDPSALALAGKVKIIPNLVRANEIWHSGVMIADEAPNEVEVVAKGKVYKKVRTYGETEGSSHNPMPWEELERKFMANVSPVLGERQSKELLGRLSRLEEEKDVRDITKLLSAR